MNIAARSAKLDEFEDVTKLINQVFRLSKNFNPTMVEEFPLLLNKNNIENMVVISQGNTIVSDANYLIQDVSIQGEKIKVAAIGAVCTHPDYEKRGLSSKVLDVVENKMYSDDVDVMIVSGTRSLYTRRNCSLIKSFYKYSFSPNPTENLDIPSNIKIVEFDNNSINYDDLNRIIQMYNQNSTRYLRTKKEFTTLLHSATMPWGPISYKKILVKNNDLTIGYIILRVIENDGNPFAEVAEMSLDNYYVENILKNICYKYNFKKIVYYVHVRNTKDQLQSISNKELDYQQGSLKIINFEKLCKSLSKYFKSYFDLNFVDNLQFIQNNNKYIIKYKNEELVIDDLSKLNKLFFEYNESQFEEFKDLENIYSFAKTVFPLDFPWTANLNYQ